MQAASVDALGDRAPTIGKSSGRRRLPRTPSVVCPFWTTSYVPLRRRRSTECGGAPVRNPRGSGGSLRTREPFEVFTCAARARRRHGRAVQTPGAEPMSPLTAPPACAAALGTRDHCLARPRTADARTGGVRYGPRCPDPASRGADHDPTQRQAMTTDGRGGCRRVAWPPERGRRLPPLDGQRGAAVIRGSDEQTEHRRDLS